MKKLSIVIALLVVLGLGYAVVHAYPVGSGNIEAPQTGVYKQGLSANQTLGATAQIGANTYRFVKNNCGNIAYQGEPAFMRISSADGYTVTSYESSAMLEHFQGIWACDQYGGTSIQPLAMGWIVEKGVCSAYISGEGTNIAVGDVLGGMITLTTTNAASAQSYMKFLRGTNTTMASSFEIVSPIALEVRLTTTQAATSMLKVWLK